MFDSDYKIKGTHATSVKYLSKKTTQNDNSAKSIGIFSSAVEIYKIAGLIGITTQRMSNENNDTQEDITIFAAAMINHKEELDLAFRLVMLCDDTSGLTADEKIERAFAQDENKEKLMANMNLFNAYVRGGIEWLYESITNGVTNSEDIEQYMRNIKALIEDFSNIKI